MQTDHTVTETRERIPIMKSSNTMFRTICWLAMVVALGSFCLMKLGARNAQAASGQGQVIIIDQEGHTIPNGRPSATSQIFDVTVGPGGDNIFSPATLTIGVGDTVRWTWASSFHNVASGASCSANSQFCSPNNMNCAAGTLSNSGAVYQHTFTQAGTFAYFCSQHCAQGMTGTVNVVAGCASPPSGMVAWWPGDGSGRDIQGRNGGAVQGDAIFVAGKVGQSFRLDGNGDRILVGRAPDLQLQDFTIDAWIKRASATLVTNDPVGVPGGTFFAYGNQGYGFAIDQQTSRIFLTQIGVSAAFSVGTVTDTNYHHVAVTKQGGTVTFYVDGVADAPVTYNPTFTFTSAAAIGARGDADLRNAFFGDIDELEIFNRVLSPSEIQAIFNAGAAGKCKAPQPIAAVSRKFHGGLGPFDIDLTPNSTAGIECRSGGGAGLYQMIVQFAGPVTVTNATILGGSGAVSGFSHTGGTSTIDLMNVTNVQTLLVKLNGVNDGTLSGDVPVAMSVLIGDANGNGGVNASDIGQVKSLSGQAVTSANFRSDVTASGGTINASDIGLVKSVSGTQLP